MPSLADIRGRLTEHRPTVLPLAGRRQAAVAALLREPAGHGAEILFIERARRRGDPWSGQIALPGGKFEPGDRDALEVARRETREEVGVDLGGIEAVARLDDIEGRRDGKTAGLVIACFVFEIAEAVELVPCADEVHDALWVPVRDLADPARLVRYEHPTTPHPYPGVRLDERRVVWGLTYRFLRRMLGVLGHELPAVDRFARVPGSAAGRVAEPAAVPGTEPGSGPAAGPDRQGTPGAGG